MLYRCKSEVVRTYFQPWLSSSSRERFLGRAHTNRHFSRTLIPSTRILAGFITINTDGTVDSKNLYHAAISLNRWAICAVLNKTVGQNNESIITTQGYIIYRIIMNSVEHPQLVASLIACLFAIVTLISK